ncbi:hypothetical protein F4604DRAFT_1677600 [Suillus subluteus]|nr:hypothetical protein F4604DRAFT_1677600 [Suillus subluteus]
MARTKRSRGVQPRLNDRETTALQSHIEDWEKASGKERQLIFKAAAREAKVLAPKMDKELLKERKYSPLTDIPTVVPQSQEGPDQFQSIHQAKKEMDSTQIREEIEEETGEKPAHKEVLRRYQPTMMAIMHRLDKKELQEAEAKADKWTNQAPDAAVQAKTARKKGEKMVKNFAKEMFTQAGMRVFVLGSWMDEKGGLLTSGFDFNEQLGKGSSFMKGKDWQAILPVWEEFIGDAFDHDQDQDATLLGGTRRVPKPYHEFKLDRSGSPMLPEMDNLSLETKKAMIWSFLTIHYRTCCGNPKVLVPWSDIMKGQSRFMSSTYLPDDTKILEPSKMLRTDANAILDFWWDRQETQVGPTLKFKAWMDEKGRMCSPVAEDGSDGDANDESTSARPTRKPSATTTLSLTSIPKGRLSSTKRPYISSTEEECEKTKAEASPPVVQQRLHRHANAEDTDRSDDRPVPKSFGKRARAKTIISVPHVTEESDQSTQASRVTRSFSPRSTRQGMETRRGLEHLRAPPMV